MTRGRDLVGRYQIGYINTVTGGGAVVTGRSLCCVCCGGGGGGGEEGLEDEWESVSRKPERTVNITFC